MNRIHSAFVSIVILTLTLFSCSPAKFKPLLKARYDNISDTLRYVSVVNPKPASEVYRIQAYDMLSVRNINIEQIIQPAGGGGQVGQQTSGQSSEAANSGFRVEADGTVNLPVIGKVEVAGLTRKEATDRIQNLYKQSYVKDPLMDVYVLSPKITILGEVSSQGTFELQNEHTSLVEALGMAGGLSERANPKTVKIIRGDKSNPEIIYVNLENLQSLASSKLTLQNKDIVYVGQDKKIEKYEKSQSGFGLFQSVLVVVSTGLVVFSTFFK